MVYTLGESLLDIIINDLNNVVARPGGAMLNTAVSLGRSEIDVSLITELGDDNTAGLIISFLANNNVSIKTINQYTNNTTSLALAFLDDNKKPSYTFIKNYPIKRELKKISEFTENDILLFGSLYSLDIQIRNSLSSLVKDARYHNSTIIYDPNIRNAHHLKDKDLMQALIENIKISNIVKGSDEDFMNIFGTTDTLSQLNEIRRINSEAIVIITQGRSGIFCDSIGRQFSLPAIETEILSTIGAGDAFSAGIIYAIRTLNINTNKQIQDHIEEILLSGLQFSAQVCNSLDNYISQIPDY